MAHLDAAILVGTESTYGTYAAPTRGFEGKVDNFTSSIEPLDSVGFRAGMEAVRSDRVIMMDKGGTGSIQVDFLNKGMGMLLKGALGIDTAPVQQAATPAYMQSFSSAVDGPDESYTVQVLRNRISGTMDPFSYLGCVYTGWSLTQNAAGLLVFDASLDFQTVTTAQTAATPTYPATAKPFHFGNAVVNIGGVPLANVRDFSLTAELGMKTDRFYLRNNSLKDMPKRNAVPTYTGQITTDYTDLSRFTEFKNGTVVTNVTVVWKGDLISGAYYHQLTATLPAIMWTGDTPTASLTDLTNQPLPFRVLDDGTNPAVKLEIISTDTAI